MTNKEAKEIMSKVTFYWEVGEQTLTQNQINEALNLAIKALEQEPKTGHWIDIQYFKADDTYYRPKCPFCSIEPKDYSNYCPNCGADLRESEGEET